MIEDDEYGEDWAFDDEDTEDEYEEHRRADERERAQAVREGLR